MIGGFLPFQPALIGTVPRGLYSAALSAVEEKGQSHSDGPADGPGAPYTQRRSGAGGEDEGQRHTQKQVGESSRHELPHGADPPKNTVSHQFEGNHEIEGGENPEELSACSQRFHGTPVHKQQQQILSQDNICETERNAQTPHQRPPGAEPFPNPLVFLGTQILGGIIGDAVADGGK